MAKRKGMSKKSRFEVFKRDGFRCQYCGATPPRAVLEVDHIVPVSAGGKNTVGNLLTSCFDCNRGKSDRPLNAVPDSLLMQQEELTERRAQMRAFAHWQEEQHAHEEERVVGLSRHWCNIMLPADSQGQYRCGPQRENSLRVFLSKGLDETTIRGFMSTAQSRMRCCLDDDDRAWRYFCGCCWKNMKSTEPQE